MNQRLKYYLTTYLPVISSFITASVQLCFIDRKVFRGWFISQAVVFVLAWALCFFLFRPTARKQLTIQVAGRLKRGSGSASILG
jgi:hypothetical protein